jgi:hypothetical protein
MFLPFQRWKIFAPIIRGGSLALLALAGFACATILSVASFAQQPGTNVNVLPAYPTGNPSPPFPPPPISLTDAIRGDGYLQRQNEPAVATSTYNPDHLLAAFNDYRTVSIQNDTGLPGSAASAWIGLSRSYDRGQTWFGSMVPCFPQDPAPLCANSPLTGLQSGSDPTLATTPGGHFYLGALFFTSGGISNVAVVHYRDVPDTDGGDTIRYQGAVIVEKGSQSDSGNFNDKPAIAADIARGTTSASVCGSVYIAFTIFNGGGGSAPFTSKLGFSRSTQGNCGSSWSHSIYLNKTYKQNQGAAMAVDPKTGKIYVVWRHVFQAGGDGFPDSILMVASSDGGSTFSDPVPITRSGFAPFDQPGLATTNFPNNPAFRSNSFPTIAVDGNGNVYIADQERNSPTGYYEPRIIIRTSTDGGRTWTGIVADSSTPSTGAQQFMPVLSSGGGLLKLMWYDFREQNQVSDSIAGGYYVTGFDRQMKTYVAQSTALDANHNPVFSASVPVTQYLTDVNTGQIPTVGGYPGPLKTYPAVNRPNLPMYNGGTNAFTGDYINHATASPFVPNPGGTTAFRWAFQATDFIAMPSFGVWADSRDVVFPTSPMGGGTTPIIDDTTGWKTYAPPGTGQPSCVNAGARNANVYLSEIKPGVIAASPATSRQLVDGTTKHAPMERAFPIYIENPNADTPNQTPPGEFFRVSFINLDQAFPVSGSFAQGTESPSPKPVDLEILQFSSAAVTLFVFCPLCNSSHPFAPFEVTVQQIPALGSPSLTPGGFQTTIFFDSDPTAPLVTNTNLGTQETHNASVTGPVFNNPTNPTYNNPTYNNPTYNNPTYNNVAPEDFPSPVGDFVWQVTDMGNNASAYTALVNINQSQIHGFRYELIVSRAYNFPGFNGCNSQPIPTGSVISIIPNPTYNNPTYNNPTYNNPTYNNPTYNNASFAAVPPPAGSTSAATALNTASTSTSASTDDGTTKMPLATDPVYFVLRVYRATTGPVLSADEQNNIIANTLFLVFPQAPNTGTTVLGGTPTAQPPAPPSSSKVFSVVTNTNDSGPGSLRQAMLDVNAQSSSSTASIVFNISASGVQTIMPQTDLPTLTQPALIDATTQPGYAGTPVIELNGTAVATGIHISAGGSTVRGFSINRFSGDGILLDTKGGDVIQGNYVGTDASGATAQPNGGNGIHIIATPNNVVGGTASSTRNVISGNGGEGLRIDGTLATGNIVQGNYIGTDVSGSAAVGNGASGVYIRRAPANSVIGNVVSGNVGFAGITICGNDPGGCGGGDISGINETSIAAGNVVQGNLVGTNSAGTTALGNNQAGVSVDGAPNTLVGGTTAATQNVISFNGTNDVQIFSPDANGNKIQGNTIQGTTANNDVGISVAAGTGNTLSANSISGHAGLGIDLAPSGVNANTANGPHNFPVITSAQVAGGNTTITGTLNSTANAKFTIEFFSNAACNASGNGEGATFLGSTTVTTDGSGNASFTAVVGPASGNVFTTTATDAGGTTSEFSACFPAPVFIGTLMPGQSFNGYRHFLGQLRGLDIELAGKTQHRPITSDLSNATAIALPQSPILVLSRTSEYVGSNYD